MISRDFYVYGIFNSDWNEFFYIGKGSGDRYKLLSQRNPIIKKVLSRYNCESKILVSNLTEDEAYKKELEIKNQFILDGRPILDCEQVHKYKIRQRQGIDTMPIIDGKRVSSKTGRPTGRPKAEYPDQWKEVYTDWKTGNITANKAMQMLGMTRTTFYKLVKQM